MLTNSNILKRTLLKNVEWHLESNGACQESLGLNFYYDCYDMLLIAEFLSKDEAFKWFVKACDIMRILDPNIVFFFEKSTSFTNSMTEKLTEVSYDEALSITFRFQTCFLSVSEIASTNEKVKVESFIDDIYEKIMKNNKTDSFGRHTVDLLHVDCT